MNRPTRCPPGLMALVSTLLVLPGLPALAQEDCFDFSRFLTCPPGPARCSLGPNPRSCAQDCASCTPDFDDDADCVVDEEILNDEDDDGDGLVDEDISCLNTCNPMSYECPSSTIPATSLDVPPPVQAPVSLPAAVAHWSCSGLPDDRLELTLEVEPDAERPEPFCSGFLLRLRLRSAATGEVYFEGPAAALFTRRWESLDRSLVADAEGNVQVFRYVLRAELKRLVDYARLPAALQVPCNEDQGARKHLFFYGYMDLARDASQPLEPSRHRTSLVLGHSPGRMTHPLDSYRPSENLCGFADVSLRPLPPADRRAHDDQGWFLVAPGTGFTFSPVARTPVGQKTYGRIRLVPNGTSPCSKETRMCESQFLDPGAGGACGARIRHRQVRLCGQDDTPACPVFNIVSSTKCDTIANDRLAFLPVGAWSRTEYPALTSASLVEGGLVCDNNFEPYWYGAYTFLPSPGLWQGPPEALDVSDNQVVRPAGAGTWLIGSVNWFDEGGPLERLMPVQFRVMSFFSSSNPDIPTLAPCEAHARLQSLGTPACGPPGPLRLTGAGSTLLNCCQCGGIEYRWSRRDGTAWVVLRDWDSAPDWSESPGPSVPTRYRLEVRCSTSQRLCVDEATLETVIYEPIVVDAGADLTLCEGQSTTLAPAIQGGTPPLACGWAPAAGLLDPFACSTTATPAVTTAYTLTVRDAAGACTASDALELRVVARPVADAGGPGPLTAPAPLGAPPCDPSLLYAWAPPAGLSSTTLCDPLADPAQQTDYCLVVTDPGRGCASAPDCVTVRPRLCDPATQTPGRVRELKAVKAGTDVRFEWLAEPLASGGYRIYRTVRKEDIAASRTAGDRVVATPPGIGSTRGTDPGAVLPVPGRRYFYQAVGVCVDGLLEGPI